MNRSEPTAFELIPAIDLIGGKCVRLSQGDYAQKTVYHDDPVELALRLEAAGVRRLHLVDLDGAKAGRVINLPVLEKIAAACSLRIDFGGGVKTEADVRAVFAAGAHFVTIGTVAVREPERVREWIAAFGADKFFLGADARNGNIAVSGWQESTNLPVAAFIRSYAAEGISAVFCTDISRDGMLQGPATGLYEALLRECPGVLLTGSGGVRDMNDVRVLQQCGCAGVIVGKAIYEGRISLKEIEQFNSQTSS